MSDYKPFFDLYGQVREEVSDFQIRVREDSRVIRFLHRILFLKGWHPHWIDSYCTTLFNVLYMPDEIVGTPVGYVMLRQHLHHIRMWSRYGLLYGLLYLLVPPYRAYNELEAHKLAVQAQAQLLDGHVSKETLQFYAGLFCDNSYLWMFPYRKYIYERLLLHCVYNNIALVD
jgi:hypothetical protein